jgi:hypothetical protein
VEGGGDGWDWDWESEERKEDVCGEEVDRMPGGLVTLRVAPVNADEDRWGMAFDFEFEEGLGRQDWILEVLERAEQTVSAVHISAASLYVLVATLSLFFLIFFFGALKTFSYPSSSDEDDRQRTLSCCRSALDIRLPLVFLDVALGRDAILSLLWKESCQDINEI